MLRSATSLCGEDVAPSLSLLLATTNDFHRQDVATAESLGVRPDVTVMGVIPGTPAAVAGVRKGDLLRAINGTPVPTGKKATAGTLKLIRRELELSPTVSLTLDRNGSPETVAVATDTLCSYRTIVVADDSVNAFADGENIGITTGMLRFVETDQELATVIGHELAHNAMGHIDAKTGNAVLGTIFDVLAAAYGVNTQGAFGNAGAQAYSQAFEQEADYVGVYALALANMDLDGTANFWRRMGSELGGIKAQYGSSHPGSTERYLAIESAVSEVREKVVQMEPLTPNLKKEANKHSPDSSKQK